MRTSNGQTIGAGMSSNARATADTRNVSLMNRELTPAQEALLDQVVFFDPLELSANLKRIHDMALYHTDIGIDEDDKTALYQVNTLSEILMKIAKET